MCFKCHFVVLQHFSSLVLLESLETSCSTSLQGEGGCPASPGSSSSVCSEHSKALAQCEQTSSHLRICQGRSQVLPSLQNKEIRWVVFAVSQQLTHQLCKQQHQQVEQSPCPWEFMIQKKTRKRGRKTRTQKQMQA